MRGLHWLAALALLLSMHPEATAAAGVRIFTRTANSAAPENLAQGDSGPINRVTYLIGGVEAADTGIVTLCIYPGGVRMQCKHRIASVETGPEKRLRLTVEIPDIDRGNAVTVRIVSRNGQTDDRFVLVNRARIVHEIEGLTLPDGDRSQLDGRGQEVPSTEIGTMRAATQIALSTSSAPACGEIYSRWVGATATDPVFTSAFGALPGSVVVARPPARAPISANNGPEWLVTYPRAASRVQFIAHYEIEYRVRYCPPSS
jgi:hypothetical protein